MTLDVKVGDYIYWKSPLKNSTAYKDGDYGIVTKIIKSECGNYLKYYAKWLEDDWHTYWVYLKDIKEILTKEEFENRVMVMNI